jgi:hypothetical protein
VSERDPKKTAASGDPGSGVPRANEPVRVERQYIPMPIGFSAFDLIFAAVVGFVILTAGIQLGRALAAGGN